MAVRLGFDWRAWESGSWAPGKTHRVLLGWPDEYWVIRYGLFQILEKLERPAAK